MAIILGIDIGGSTTKIAAVNNKYQGAEALLGTRRVRSDEQLTSLHGAIEAVLHELGLAWAQVDRIVLTGAGATKSQGDIFGIPTVQIGELEAIGKGGLLLSGKTEALVISMGTGTAFVMAKGDSVQHLGGSGVGGGTLMGMAYPLTGEKTIEGILACADKGDLANVDLLYGDIAQEESATLPFYTTVGNFAKIKASASKGDMALGLLNMIYQVAGIMAVLACKGSGCRDIVATGTLATLPYAELLLERVGQLHQMNFIIPEHAAYATVLGAVALAENQK